MALIDRYGVAKTQRIGNDSVYGTGFDGTVTIASNTSLSRDMYYMNLTVNNGVHLNTNGFRVFVRNILTLNGTVGVNASTTVSDGTVKGTTPAATSQSAGIGGNAFGATYTVSQIPSSLFNYVETAVLGAYVNSSGTTVPVAGGAGGGNGAAGTATPQTPAGGAGAGQLSRNPLAPGGPGTAGTVGAAAPLASAGAAGAGGPVVVIAAKTITGSGQILSRGQNATAGGSSASGSLGTAGTTAPNQAVQHHVDGSAHYITGDGTHGPHATTPTPNLPHGSHVGATSQVLHADRYVNFSVYHNDFCPSAEHGAFGHYHGYAGVIHDNIKGYHGHSPVSPAESTGSFHAINGIPHNHGHRNHSGIAFSGYGHSQHVDAPQAEHVNHHGHGSLHCSNSKGSFTVPRVQHTRVGYAHYHVSRNAGTVSHVGHTTKTGGAGGAAGTGAGTTAGTNGQSGGGGGIIVVTDSSLTGVTTSTAGGTISSSTASSGTALVIINS
jgi:hypothetical protein